MESEKEIIDFIKGGRLRVGPVSFEIEDVASRYSSDQPDILMKAKWGDSEALFAAELKRYGSDNAILQAANQALYFAERLNMKPLVLVPWLSEEQLLSLERRNVSGIDLCGNGVLLAPGISVFRSGSPNKFPASRPIRRIYEGTSSLVARVFLLKPKYRTVSAVYEEVISRGGEITLPTVSKALKQLEDDVIIVKSSDGIRLVQATKLLNRLRENYEAPKRSAIVRCKITVDDDIPKILNKAAKRANLRLVLSGASSVEYYASMGRDPMDSYFCTAIPDDELEDLGAKIDTTSRFPNTEFQVTSSEYVYFDARKDKKGRVVASPIQTYLELATSDKRGQETAERIEKDILAKLPDIQRERA